MMSPTYMDPRVATEISQLPDGRLRFRTTAIAGSGLGEISDKGRSVGCGITGAVGMVGGLIASIYGGEGGGKGVGTGTGTLATALDCNKASRLSAEQIASEAAAAQKYAADQALAAEKERTKRTEKLMVGGGIAAAVLLAVWLVT